MPVAATAAVNARALWYLSRGFGLVALILLSVVMVLGLTQRSVWPGRAGPVS
jgi:hypothetical protein